MQSACRPDARPRLGGHAATAAFPAPRPHRPHPRPAWHRCSAVGNVDTEVGLAHDLKLSVTADVDHEVSPRWAEAIRGLEGTTQRGIVRRATAHATPAAGTVIRPEPIPTARRGSAYCRDIPVSRS